MGNITHIILAICILIVTSFGVLISFGILSLIIHHRQQHPINTSTLLLCNTYIAILYTCLNFIIMYGYSLYGELYENVNFDQWWCYIHTYIVHVGLCSMFFSYFLQSIFRFFRIVLYQYRRLQTFQFMLGFIFIQWLISFLLIMLILLLKCFEYLPGHYHCQILFSNFSGLLIAMAMIYFGPTIASGIVYIYIIYYTKYKTNSTIQQNLNRSNQRDLIVLRRIIILIGSMVFLSLPTLILWTIYLATGYLHPLTYYLEWLLFALSSLVLSIASAILSPHLYRLMKIQWKRRRQIQPIVINNIQQGN